MSTSTPPDPPASGGEAVVNVDPWVRWPCVTWCAYTTDPWAAYRTARASAETVRPPTAPNRVVVSVDAARLLNFAELTMQRTELLQDTLVVDYAASCELPEWFHCSGRVQMWDVALRLLSDPQQAADFGPE